jgi:Holliday junction DNA helicase RuvA
MIGYIKGNVLSCDNGIVLLENNGIGYEITCSSSVYQKLCADKKGEVYTYMSVREDGVSLFGFISPEEKSMFLKLISVSGVGPKMGITVLSGLSLADLVTKIATQDVKGLSKVKGLGKKTAERIILELREKIGCVDQDTGEVLLFNDKPVEESVNQDAVVALMSLGFTKAESVTAVKKAQDAGQTQIDKIIAFALKSMN